jgi:hypothetical protein
MKARTWNIAFALMLTLFAATAIPFFSVALDDFGGFDGLPGDFEDGFDGDFDDGLDGDFDDGIPGDFDDGVPGDFDDGIGAAPDPGDGTGDDGFDPFDDNLDPFEPPPGLPGGTDTIPDPDPDDDGCIVNCGPSPDPSPRPGRSDTLRMFIHRIFLNNPFEQTAGTVLALRITFENDGNKDMDNTKVLVMIPDIQARDTIGPFDLDTGEQMTKTLFLEIPEDVEPGTYPVRLFIHNLQDKRIVHREIEIVEYS